MVDDFKNLGVCKISRRGSTTKIERNINKGVAVITRDEDSLPPRRELGIAWSALVNATTSALFADGDDCSVISIEDIAFNVAMDDEGGYAMLSVSVKGSFSAQVSADFAIKTLHDADVIAAAKLVYAEAAAYFDGVNAQTEFNLNTK